MNIIHQFFNEINENIDFSSLTSHISDIKSDFEKKAFLEIIAKLDNDFFKSGIWKEKYNCNGFVTRTTLSPFCELTFKRRYYMSKDRSLHDNFYYVDSTLKLPKRKLITDEALTLILKLCADVNSSFAASNAIPNVIISKQTVSNYIKKLNIIEDGITTITDEIEVVKEDIDVIYVEADEAHCNLQRPASSNPDTSEIKTHNSCQITVDSKNIINKLVVSHSGPKEPNLCLKRKVLANKRYFGGINISTDVLADNVCESISKQYDLSKVKFIFVSGDGAYWIKSLYKYIKNFFKSCGIETIFVLDKFHFNKYLKIVFLSNFKMIKYVRDNLENLTKESFKKLAYDFFESSDFKDDKKKEKAFLNAVNYICNNIPGIKNQKHEFYKSHCAMEGQVSHVLARRLTSRPMGFCEKNLQNITQLLIFLKNNNKLTPDIVKEWSKNFMKVGTRKYTSFVKRYKAVYDMSATLPAMNSTNTNLKDWLSKICHPRFN